MGIRLRVGRLSSLAPMIIGVAACAHSTSATVDVPIAFGRWRPPEGQACYVDVFQPRELPLLSTLLDSAAIVGELRTRPEGSVLLALAFHPSGRTARARVIDRRMPAPAADSIEALLMRSLRAPSTEEEWGARLLASTGSSAALSLARREVCPPALARIHPLASPNVAMTREPDVVPSPDWIIRQAAPPGGVPRSTLERAIAGLPVRDTTSLTVDPAGIALDIAAFGDTVLTLRVLIDTTGAIAHAEISRAASATVDKTRLVAELARYRFHPALEDRVRTPAWIILKIK